MSENGMLMRRGAVMRLLGVSRWTMDKLVETGTLREIPALHKGARAYYRRADVEKLSERKNETGKENRRV